MQEFWYSGPGGIGGNGVGSTKWLQTGPFREGDWSLTPSAGNDCLKRNFNGNPPDVIVINQLLLINYTDFETFEVGKHFFFFFLIFNFF